MIKRLALGLIAGVIGTQVIYALTDSRIDNEIYGRPANLRVTLVDRTARITGTIVKQKNCRLTPEDPAYARLYSGSRPVAELMLRRRRDNAPAGTVTRAGAGETVTIDAYVPLRPQQRRFTTLEIIVTCERESDGATVRATIGPLEPQ